jgi:hypothetical protein
VLSVVPVTAPALVARSTHDGPWNDQQAMVLALNRALYRYLIGSLSTVSQSLYRLPRVHPATRAGAVTGATPGTIAPDPRRKYWAPYWTRRFLCTHQLLMAIAEPLWSIMTPSTSSRYIGWVTPHTGVCRPPLRGLIGPRGRRTVNGDTRSPGTRLNIPCQAETREVL